ncbi:hypothetical protein [Pseudomonas syringae]|uniref:hypothetical protein n=1 Tax=Pseudomonas syringae TaxID=317 RepID=UPI00139671C5|nr:hypothetical protein [Pseudomonas syringae]
MSKNDSVANLAKKITRKAENCQKIVEKQVMQPTVAQPTADQQAAARSTSQRVQQAARVLVTQALWALAQSVQYSICEFHMLRTADFEIYRSVVAASFP